MRQIALLSLLLLSGASAIAAKPDLPVPACPEPYRQPLFISPVGEPFRIKGDDEDPVRRWFEQVDRDRDGRLTMAEMLADADRYFVILDKDSSGELLPDEVHAYEDEIPEIRLYQRRPEAGTSERIAEDKARAKAQRSKPKRGAPIGYDGAAGAGRYAFLNIPNPIASADGDFNRAVDLKEFRAAAAERFRTIDSDQQKALTLNRLPKTPAQILANAACLARVQDQAKTKGDRR